VTKLHDKLAEVTIEEGDLQQEKC